jgi:DNA-binding SARP family transcriptional activator
MGNWRDLRDLLWDSWTQVTQVLTQNQRFSELGNIGNRLIPRILESQWQQLIEPLIESLLMTGDISGADSVVYQLKETAGWQELSDQLAALAIRCQMPQMVARWAD